MFKQSNKFRKEIIISVLLHIIILFLVNKDFFNKYDKITVLKKNNQITNAILVNSNSAIQNYNLQKLQLSNKKQITWQYEKQKITQKHSKQHESWHSQIHKSPFEYKRKLKAVLKTVQKNNQKKSNQEINKRNTTMSVNKIPLNKIKNFSKNSSYNEDYTKNKNIRNTNNISFKVKNNKDEILLNTNINNYAKQIKLAIEKCLYNVSSYSGKTCTLRIKLESSGTISNIQYKSGDPVLCNAAVAAALQAKIPEPLSPEIYKVFKNISLDFKF